MQSALVQGPSDFVAIDIEATGMEPSRDHIIEIGLVRFSRDHIVDRFESLVHTPVAPTTDITDLTGITAADLENAPSFRDLAPKIRTFIGSRPLVAHSVEMDVAMLEAAGLRVANRQFDSFRLSTLLIPDLASYSLRAVARHLGVTVDAVHRGAADSELTAVVFQKLLARLDCYDGGLLDHVATLAKRAGWSEAALFRNAAESELTGPIFTPGAIERRLAPELAFLEERERPEPLRRTGSTRPVSVKEVEQALSGQGAVSHVLDRFEYRTEQIEMAKVVTHALNDDGQLMVEAGTGTGKSMAYLLPSALLAVERGERVVISTDTIALQDQLHQKDVPDLRRVLRRLPGSPEVETAMLKGRANYLCLRRWFQQQRTPADDPVEAGVRAKIMLWLDQTETGDRSELRLSGEEERYWRSNAAEEDACVPSRCVYNQRNQCFLFRARRNAERAHLIIANHALLLSDRVASSRILPEYDRLVIDEAHHLEDQATSHFGYVLDQRSLDDHMNGLSGVTAGVETGTIATANAFLSHSAEQKAVDQTPKALSLSKMATERAPAVQADIADLFLRLNELVRQQGGGRGGYSSSVRVTPGVRRGSDWAQLEIIWERLDKGLADLASVVRWFADVLDGLPIPDDDENPESIQRDELVLDCVAALRTGQELAGKLLDIFGTPAEDHIYWIEKSPVQGLISIHVAPLFVDELLREQLFNRLRTSVLTSATLTTDGTFDFVAGRLGLPDADRVSLPSPFDHERSTMLYLADDIPEPQHQGYQRVLHQTLEQLCEATGGRALVLFTSHSALQAAYRTIKDPLDARGIVVLGQRIDGGPRQLVERLRSSDRVVVLGTSSFWEGVDVVGSALSLLVIAKLPFAVPSDPVFAARSELLEQPFLDYAVPQAVLKFKQGFGRLIRSRSDRGVCVVLDRRVVSKRYGASFVQSLPSCHVRVGRSHDAADAAADWLVRDA